MYLKVSIEEYVLSKCRRYNDHNTHDELFPYVFHGRNRVEPNVLNDLFPKIVSDVSLKRNCTLLLETNVIQSRG